MELKKLKSDVIERIRSSYSINTVSQCVTELVLNSLDAKSTAIAIRVNLVTFKIQVVDNGDGILEKNMSLLGLRYFTNKCKNLEELEQYMNHYGFRGEAIASISECSKSVNITSRHYTSIHTYSRTLGNHSVDLKKTKSRPSVGTTVTIEGFFHNFPVRRKRVIAELELEEVKKEIESLIILHPDVTFSVRNDVECELILNSHKCKDLISSFKQIHPNLGDDFSLMKISKSKLTIDALLYKKMSENKNIQYIYVNKRPIISSKIQKLIRSLFKKNQKVDRKNPIASLTKYPVFVINIKCPVSRVDLLSNSTKTMVEFDNWDLVYRSINKLVNSFFGNNKRSKKTEKFLNDEELKRDCGVSQIFGAHRKFGYKRRRDEDENNDVGNIVTGMQNVENIPKKISNNTFKTDNNDIIVSNIYTHKNNPKESQRVNDGEENLHISDTTPLKKTCRSHEEFKKFKKPLAITVYTDKMQKNLENNLLLEKQDDLKSSISKFTNDQNKGKNLIMDMFLKSTQIYNSDDNPDRLYGSQETIYEEESNFQLENNYRSEFNGMSNTMSISVNVKSTRKIRKRKAPKERLSNKYVQTEMIDGKIISRAVQTSEHEEYEKVKNKNRSSMERLKCTMNSNNYTVVLSDSGETVHYKFVNKKFHEDYIEPRKVDITQKCHCCCHAVCKNKAFNFETKYCISNPVERKIETPGMNPTVNYSLTKQVHENLLNHQPMNRKAPNRFTFGNWNFNVERKEKTFHNYESSPYFLANRYSRNNLVSCRQHPQYLINRYKTDLCASSVPPHLNINHSLEFDEKKSDHYPMHPFSNPSNFLLDNPRLAENTRHRSLRQLETTMNSTVYCKFNPAHSSTQQNYRNDWENISIAHVKLSNLDTRKDWTIDSFGQFKPFLFSTQKNCENDCHEKQNLLFTPSPVEKGYLVSESLMDILNDTQENVKDVGSCVSNSIDEQFNEGIEQKHSNLSKRKTQEILYHEFEAEKDLIAKEFSNWDCQFTQEFGEDWLKKINKCGNCYYMNKKSGFTTFHTPVLVGEQFKFGKRFDFMPKGMSPILTETKHVDKSLSQHGKDTLLEYIMESYKYELLYIKWQHYLCDVDPDIFFKNIYEEKLKIFEGVVPKISAMKKNKNMDNVISFTKDLFANIEVIGQLDRKFIVVLEKASNLLILFDQHAIHERIRLEELMKKYDGAKSKCIEKITFFVPQNDLAILKNHESYLNYLGFSVEFFANGFNVSTVPLCLFSKFNEDIFSDTLNKMLQLLVKEIIEHLKSTRGVHLKSMPRLLQNIVNLEACRGAIKFGDGLNKDRCKELLVRLSSCDLPFQCAHGRPTLVPLLVLELNEKKMHSKPNIHKLKPTT